MGKLNPYPKATYTPLGLDNPANQGLASADRQWCAAIAACASSHAGHELKGECRKLGAVLARTRLMQGFTHQGVTPEIANRMIWAVTGDPLMPTRHMPHDSVFTDSVNGLKPSRYQIDAVRGLTRAGGLIGMAVGLGKTLTALLAVRCALVEQVAPRVAVFCPLNAMGVWESQREYAEKTLGVEFHLFSIDSAHKCTALPRTGGVLIIDEVHLAGVATTRRTKSLFEIRKGFEVCLGLSGTLLHAGIEKAMTMMDLAVPGSMGFASRWKAGEHFNCLHRKMIGNRKVTELGVVPAAKQDEFNKYFSRVAQVLTADDDEVKQETGIPDQHLHTIDLYTGSATPLEYLTELAIAEYEKTGEIPHASALRHLALRQGFEEKWNWFVDFVGDRDDGDPLVIYAAYHDTLDALVDAFDGVVPVVRIDGAVIGELRTLRVEAFQGGDADVFLGQCDAACTAITLTRANTSMVFDHTLKGPNYAQLLGRTRRRGQGRVCHHYDLVTNPVQRFALERLRKGEDANAAFAQFTVQLKENGHAQ